MNIFGWKTILCFVGGLPSSLEGELWGSHINWSNFQPVAGFSRANCWVLSSDHEPWTEGQTLKWEKYKMLISYGNSKQMFNKILSVTGSIQWFWFTYGITGVAHQISPVALWYLSQTPYLSSCTHGSRGPNREILIRCDFVEHWMVGLGQDVVCSIRLLNFRGMDAKTRNS